MIRVSEVKSASSAAFDVAVTAEVGVKIEGVFEGKVKAAGPVQP